MKKSKILAEFMVGNMYYDSILGSYMIISEIDIKTDNAIGVFLFQDVFSEPFGIKEVLDRTSFNINNGLDDDNSERTTVYFSAHMHLTLAIEHHKRIMEGNNRAEFLGNIFPEIQRTIKNEY